MQAITTYVQVVGSSKNLAKRIEAIAMLTAGLVLKQAYNSLICNCLLRFKI